MDKPSQLSLHIAKELMYAREDSKIEAVQIISEGICELETQNREMRNLLLRLNSARIAMNESSVIAALNDVDAFFKEQN